MVRHAARIEEIIGDHIALKPAGKELLGLCPFHDDRRPSMYVSPRKQIYYCFVCAAGGDVFRFVENYHKMSAGEALRFLAQRYGVKLPDYRANDPARQQEASLREKMLAANSWAAEYFRANLVAPGGRPAMDYLRSRGLRDETIENFQLGFAPDNWTGMVQAAARCGIADESLLAVGLLKRRTDGSPFDVFRNRVIFPILDPSDHIIGFGGRILPAPSLPEESASSTANDPRPVNPKYLNSPETAIFSKRETLYGLHRARREIIRTGTAVIVEGYMDVIACHQSGATHVLATLGTALTERHVVLLRRFCNRLVLVFDNDEAGSRAVDRAIELLLPYPIDVCITHISEGKDPCDFCIARGGAAFAGLLAGAQDALEYKWEQLVGVLKAGGSLTRKQDASLAMLRLVAAAVLNERTDPIRRGLLEQNLAQRIGMPLEEVHRTIIRLGRTAPPSDRQAPTVDSLSEPSRRCDSGLLRAEQWILGSLLTDFSLYRQFSQDIDWKLFSPDRLAPLAAVLLAYLDGAADLTKCSLADFLANLQTPALVRAAVEAQTEAEGGNLKEKIADALALLKKVPGGGSEEPPPGETTDPPDPLADLLRRAQEAHRLGMNQRVLGPRILPEKR